MKTVCRVDMLPVNVIRELSQNLTILKNIFDLYRPKIIQNSLTGKEHFQREDGSRFSLTLPPGRMSGMMIDTTTVSGSVQDTN